MKTGIDALDRLLGTYRRNDGQTNRADSENEPKRTHALIRGAPGSGKTTLGLQILAEHLLKSESTGGVLISLEVSPSDALLAVRGKITERLNDVLTGCSTNGRLVRIDRNKLNRHFSWGDWEIVKADLERFFKSELRTLKGRHPFIMLDSMNLLASMAQHHMTPRGRTIDLRLIVHGIWNLLESFDQATLLITNEHHPPAAGIEQTTVSESFTCDIEILLVPEPIAGHSSIPPSMMSAVGYTIERRLSEEPFSTKPQSVEMRSFCRVLKSRYTPNQSRRCAYDIVAGKGVVFAETFAGDGAILLFEENEKQKAIGEEFITRDIPHLFPALRYAVFDRPGLQRTFATQRRYTQFPPKIDVYMACFDTYWIHWYWQLCQRSAIRDAMLEAFAKRTPPLNERVLEQKQNERLRKQWANWVCAVDSEFTKCLVSKRPPNFSRLARKICGDLDRGSAEDILSALARTWNDIQVGRVRFLHVFPKAELRLFGEYQSEIISELESPSNMTGQAAHCPRSYQKDADAFLSVPYNANVSFLVVRENLLQEKLRRPKRRFVESLKAICLEQHAALEEFREWVGLPQEQHPASFERKLEAWIFKAYANNSGQPVPPIWEEILAQCENNHAERRPETWEEIFALCDMDPPHHLLLETQTFDSFLCAFLEFFWSSGNDLEITPSYLFPDRAGVAVDLFRAFHLLCLMFERGTLESNSTLNVEDFVRRFPSQVVQRKKQRADWLFARHWYSTLVDTLTARHKETKRHLWRPEKMELELLPLPYHLSSAIELQGFQNNFFNYLSLFNQFVSSLSEENREGRECTTEWKRIFESELESHKGIGQDVKRECFEAISEPRKNHLLPYFQHLFNVLEIIAKERPDTDKDNHENPYLDREQYVQMLKAQLSPDETVLLAYYCYYCDTRISSRMRELVEKFGLLPDPKKESLETEEA